MTDINLLGFKWCCSGDCGCDGGEHEVSGVATWEGYSRWVYSWVWCTCVSETQAGAKVEVSFANDVIIFENEYTNALYDVVSHSSTTNALRIKVDGGAYGGLLEIELDDGGRLGTFGGDVLFSQMEVVAGEALELEHFFKAYKSSENEDDIIAKVRFTEFMTGAVIEDEDSMTAVRVAVMADADWPLNKVRHVFGPQETAVIRYYPNDLQNVLWDIGGALHSGNLMPYLASDEPTNVSATVSVGDSSFSFRLTTIAPEGLDAIACRAFTDDDWRLRTGSIPKHGDVAVGMAVELRLMPDYVSFKNVFLQEGECEATNIDGFFVPYSAALESHGETQGALTEVGVSDLQNYAGNDLSAADFGAIPVQLDNGSFMYNITNYWYVKKSGDVFVRKNFLSIESQKFSLTVNGDLSVQKYGCIVQRGTNNIVKVIGR